MNSSIAPTPETQVAGPRLIVLGFLPVDGEVADSLQAVGAPKKPGPRALPPSFGRSVAAALARHRPQGDPEALKNQLTRRERQVCDRISEGLSNKQIASRLGIAIHTVKCHVHSILRKLGLESRVQVAVFGRSRAYPEWGDERLSA